MLRSLFTGISGLRNHQVRLDVVSNNIANINTTGYKKARVEFKDILSQTIAGAGSPSATIGGTNPKQVGLGMTINSIDSLFNQGNLQVTEVNTDLAIQGNGMFVLNDGNNTRYTRAGTFTLDSAGDLISTANGWHVQGWQGVAGVINTGTTPVSINVPVSSTLPAKATGLATYTGNLDATTAAAGTYDTSMVVYGSQGNPYTAIVRFTKGVANTWGVSLVNLLDSTGAAVVGAAIAPGNVTYTATGAYLGSGVGALTAALPAENPLAITLDFTGTTQYSADNSIVASSQNGYQSGSLVSFAVSDAGIISGSYSNGLRQDLAQVALARFTNYGGLERQGDNLFAASGNSGTPVVLPASSGGLGSIAAGTLEMSNVDLSEEFTNMITAQRGFQANSRSITTSDEILQELLTLKR